MAFLQAITTSTPPYCYDQNQAKQLMSDRLPDKRAQRYIESVYEDSGIEKRFSVVDDFMAKKSSFFPGAGNQSSRELSTRERNELFRTHAPVLASKTVHELLRQTPELLPEEITHIVTVSCTGLYNPGLDIDVIRACGLNSSIERYAINFMGCYGAFPALKMAAQFCEADQNAKVLVVALELCTLHAQLSDNLDSILANAIFADGCAACIVSGESIKNREPALALDLFSSAILPETSEHMAWTIGDNGFDIVLSRYVPKILGSNIKRSIELVLSSAQMGLNEIDIWAIHPGGKSILDKVANSLELPEEALLSSRNILRAFGNMSSVTILFVLKDIIENHTWKEGQQICAAAFGPGLSLESALLTIEH